MGLLSLNTVSPGVELVAWYVIDDLHFLHFLNVQQMTSASVCAPLWTPLQLNGLLFCCRTAATLAPAILVDIKIRRACALELMEDPKTKSDVHDTPHGGLSTLPLATPAILAGPIIETRPPDVDRAGGMLGGRRDLQAVWTNRPHQSIEGICGTAITAYGTLRP